MLNDAEIIRLHERETQRQNTSLSLIASENIVSHSVRGALATAFTNKTVEGYPGRRYHAGCEVADQLEELTRTRACTLFGSVHANVQPHSCSQANQAALLSLLKPGDKILSMELSHGGHLSHGFSQSLTGKLFEIIHYGVNRETQLIDYEMVEELAHRHRPGIVIVGSSAYSRTIDFARFRAIADSVGALLLADIAHVAGLVAARAYPSPVPYADVVTTSMYKTLRGPRGGLVLLRDEVHARALDKAVFPGLQGTPCLNALAAKAVCLGEAALPGFKRYASAVISNARSFAKIMGDANVPVVSGGTDSHLVLLDLRSLGLSGKAAAIALEEVGILCNMNLIPFDEAAPTVCSGIRFGFAASTTMGFDESEIQRVAELVISTLTKIRSDGRISDAFRLSTREEIIRLIAATSEKAAA